MRSCSRLGRRGYTRRIALVRLVTLRRSVGDGGRCVLSRALLWSMRLRELPSPRGSVRPMARGVSIATRLSARLSGQAIEYTNNLVDYDDCPRHASSNSNRPSRSPCSNFALTSAGALPRTRPVGLRIVLSNCGCSSTGCLADVADVTSEHITERHCASFRGSTRLSHCKSVTPPSAREVT